MKCKVSGKNGYIQEEDCHCFCCGEHNPKHQIKDNLTPCSKCNCMTKSIRLGRANYQCGKCKHDK